MLTPDQKEKIEQIFSMRAQMQPISLVKTWPQEPAPPSHVFQLQRIGEHYTLLPTDPNTMETPFLDGAFLFVILSSDPGRIYCGVPHHESRFVIDGHTSLSYRADVLYAGELFFRHNVLYKWTNGSGHYRPSASLGQTNLIPYLQHLLPADKFVDHWNTNNSEANQRARERGYEVPDSASAKGFGGLTSSDIAAAW
ncbi:hypothetical protein QEG73_23005 [Chitinophagaceae bacterium 26-R-25]|nr:hypothetical protein [Chitinophagaceae bacterium 26-R-25]